MAGRKPISMTAHGILDYALVLFLVGLSTARGWTATATPLLQGAAGITLLYSLLTRYQLGVIRVLPMRAHLIIDALSGASFIGAGLAAYRELGQLRASLVGFGLFGLAAALLTRAEPGRARIGAVD